MSYWNTNIMASLALYSSNIAFIGNCW